jgi:YidC/Oxa1 family membrane protein insertase
MDKRFFLALLLTGAVVVLTPVLFERPTVPVVTTTPPAASAPASTGLPSGGQPASTPAVLLPAPTDAGVASTVAPAAPDTVVLRNDLARYRFSTLGAQLLSAELPQFSRLGGRDGAVQLAHGAAPLMRLRLIAGGDTIPLERLAFTASREQGTFVSEGAPAEAEELLFRAAVGTGAIAVRYTLSPENYLARAEIRGTGIAQPAFLLVDLPTGFTSQEADSTEDARHLAYAFKPQSGGAERVDFRKPDPSERLLKPGPLTWAVAKNKYFLVGVLTEEGATSPFAELHVTGAPRVNKVALTASATVVAPLTDAGVRFEIYAGPQEWERLVGLGREFENVNPYGGWISGVVQPFATIVMRVLLWMKRTLNIEYGWILVLFGVSVRLLMWPLNSRMMRSQMAMQRLAPKIQEAQNKHKGDPEKQRVAVMAVYQEAGVSPFAALSGCLPMLLPMPILIALFFVFQNTIEFRGVSFFYLADISLKDPYYILPLLMGASMFLLSWVGMRNVPPNPQTKMMSYLMPVILTVALLNFASGLNLYYTVQNLAALPQQWLIANERAKSAPVAASAKKEKKEKKDRK